MVLKGLYAITDPLLTPYESDIILLKVETVLKAGAKIIQLRDKNNDDEFLLPIAKKLKKLCESYQAIFIVNDRIDLAIKCDAHGVHLGKDDFSFKEARQLLKEKIIGVSCYGDLERAKLAESLGANYVAFGSFFPSPTKPEAKLVKKEVLSEAKKVLKVPVCAIGGITLERAKELINLGADMIAVISDLWKAKDLFGRAKAYVELFKS